MKNGAEYSETRTWFECRIDSIWEKHGYLGTIVMKGKWLLIRKTAFKQNRNYFATFRATHYAQTTYTNQINLDPMYLVDIIRALWKFRQDWLCGQKLLECKVSKYVSTTYVAQS
jgi:hypothetical protein